MTKSELEKANLLVSFLAVTKDGLVKPYDPTPVIRKLDSLQKNGVDIGQTKDCCYPAAEIRDAKDFKPFIMAAVKEFARLTELEVV